MVLVRGVVPQRCVKMTHFLMWQSTAYNVHSVYLTDYTAIGNAIGYILHYIYDYAMNPTTISVYARYGSGDPQGTMGRVPPYRR